MKIDSKINFKVSSNKKPHSYNFHTAFFRASESLPRFGNGGKPFTNQPVNR